MGGELWEIHGGGFYRIEKFKLAPEELPPKLYWFGFKWEAYTTWLSGFALLVVVYFACTRKSFLIDPAVARPVDNGKAIARSPSAACCSPGSSTTRSAGC